MWISFLGILSNGRSYPISSPPYHSSIPAICVLLTPFCSNFSSTHGQINGQLWSIAGCTSQLCLTRYPWLLWQHTLLVLCGHLFSIPLMGSLSSVLTLNIRDTQWPPLFLLHFPVISFTFFTLAINNNWRFLNLWGLRCYLLWYSTNIFQSTATVPVQIGLGRLLAKAMCFSVTFDMSFPLFPVPELQTPLQHLSVRSGSLHHNKKEMYDRFTSVPFLPN